MVFLAVENENRQLEDLPQADFGCVHENSSSFGKEKVINWEFCEKKITPVVCFCNGSTHFFHLEPYHRRTLRFFFSRIVKPLISYDTQNNTPLLAVMELLFSRSTRYQEIITVYIILRDTLFVRCFHSWDSVLNTRREIPYQHAPMYYSLCGRVKKMAEFVLKPQCKIPEKLPYSTNFNACLWLDRSAIGFHTAPQSSTADYRKGCWWM